MALVLVGTFTLRLSLFPPPVRLFHVRPPFSIFYCQSFLLPLSLRRFAPKAPQLATWRSDRRVGRSVLGSCHACVQAAYSLHVHAHVQNSTMSHPWSDRRKLSDLMELRGCLREPGGRRINDIQHLQIISTSEHLWGLCVWIHWLVWLLMTKADHQPLLTSSPSLGHQYYFIRNILVFSDSRTFGTNQDCFLSFASVTTNYFVEIHFATSSMFSVAQPIHPEERKNTPSCDFSTLKMVLTVLILFSFLYARK